MTKAMPFDDIKIKGIGGTTTTIAPPSVISDPPYSTSIKIGSKTTDSVSIFYYNSTGGLLKIIDGGGEITPTPDRDQSIGTWSRYFISPKDNNYTFRVLDPTDMNG